MKQSNSRDRLLEMMELLGLKQSDIVKKTGINKSALSQYINGSRIPRQDQLSIIADPYGINPTWLMGYDVPMYIEIPVLDEKMKTMMIKFPQLTDDEKDIILKTIDTFIHGHTAR